MKALKKRIIKSLSIVLTLCMLACCAGCADSVETAKTGPKNTIVPPDYSDTEQIVDMYAFIGPTDGTYYDASGTQKRGVDHRTKERYQEYKDCGLSILLLLGNNAYMGSGEANVTVESEKKAFEDCRVKKDLDLCEEVGLKTIVFDNRIWRLSNCKQSLVKEGGEAEALWYVCSGDYYYGTSVETYDKASNKITTHSGTVKKVSSIFYQFDSQEKLTEYVSVLMSAYKDHPAFYGVSLFDEPPTEKLKAVGQVTQAIHSVDSEAYVHTCLLPYYGGNHELLSVADEKAFIEYLDTYLKESKNTYFCYDYYPLRGSVTSTGESENYYINDTYVRTLQLSALKAQEKNIDWEITIQSYGSGSGGSRFVNEEDIRLQSNMALAFDAVRLSYYTYWMWQNKSGVEMFQGIMSDEGDKILYNQVQKVNAETQMLAKAVLNYKYVGTYLSWDKNYGSMPAYFADVETTDLTNVANVTSSGAAVINEMYDEKNQLTGYMVVNANDTYDGIENRVSITFAGYEKAKVFTADGPVEVDLKNGNYTRIMRGGEAVLVVPY